MNRITVFAVIIHENPGMHGTWNKTGNAYQTIDFPAGMADDVPAALTG